MCNSKCYDTISIIVSLVLGVIFAILVFCFPSLFFLGILFGVPAQHLPRCSF